MKHNQKLIKLVLAALFFALAMVLPFLTGQIPEIGKMLCPMHIPAILCGFVCGWPWGLAVGFTAPIIRSLIMGGMPPMFPEAVSMAFELAVYGVVSAFMYRTLPRKKVFIYVSLVTAMVAGRIIYGIAKLACLGIRGNSYTFTAFITGTVIEALPGIIVQLILIPVVVMMLESTKILKKVQ